VDQLTASIDALIRENTDLKKQLARLQGNGSGPAAGPQGRALVTLQRRIARALNVGAPAAPAKRQTRRRVTDPHVLEIRRQALAKARQVRAEKLAAKRGEANS
jgi:hypothetical protein